MGAILCDGDGSGGKDDGVNRDEEEEGISGGGERSLNGSMYWAMRCDDIVIKPGTGIYVM